MSTSIFYALLNLLRGFNNIMRFISRTWIFYLLIVSPETAHFYSQNPWKVMKYEEFFSAQNSQKVYEKSGSVTTKA